MRLSATGPSSCWLLPRQATSAHSPLRRSLAQTPSRSPVSGVSLSAPAPIRSSRGRMFATLQWDRSLFFEVNPTDGKEGIMASMEKSKDDPKSLSSGLTRRQFLPLLGATAVAAATPSVVRAAPPSAASARFVYVGTYTAPGVPPGGT